MNAVRSVVLLALLSVAQPLLAAPQITSISPRTIQLGSSEITIVGSQFNENTQLVVGASGATAERVGEAKPDRLTFRVHTKDVSPDIYSLRVVNETGVSNPVRVAIDHLPNVAGAAEIKTLPIAMEGQLTGAAINEVSFVGAAGQRVVVDVEAQRLGSKLRPVIRLYDPRGAQIAWSPPQASLHGDARCEVALSANGVHTIELHDRTYKGAAPGFYRLKIGDLKVVEQVIPRGATRAQPTTVDFTPAGSGEPVRSEITINAPAGVWPATLPREFSGGAPGMVVSHFHEFAEGAPAATQPLPTPAAITGTLAAAAERDEFRFQVTPEAKYRVEVFAASHGSPLDGVVVVKNNSGGQLAQNDDRADRVDPMVDFTAPKGVAEVVVSLYDLHRKGGSGFSYRLVVSPLRAPWRVAASQSNIGVPVGGRALVKLVSTGPAPTDNAAIQTWPENTSPLQIENVAINRRNPAALMVVSTAEPFDPFVTHLGAFAADESRVVDVKGQSGSYQPWLDNEFVFYSAPRKLNVDWRLAGEPPKLTAGGVVKFPITLSHVKGVTGPLRLSLLTSHVGPTKTVKQNNVDVQVPDEARTFRLASQAVYDNSPGETEIEIAVPADAPLQSFQLGLVAEQLSEDKKQVVATNASTVIAGSIVHPLRLNLAGEAKVQAVAGAGATGSLKGSIVRGEDFTGPVTITLIGLAKEYPAPSVELPADATEFTLEVRFPAAAKPADLAGVRVQATLKSGEAAYVSNETAVAVKVVAGKK